MHFTKLSVRLRVAAFLGALLFFVFAASANQPVSAIYDTSTVVTVSGRVESIEQHQCSYGWSNGHARQAPLASWLGTHIILRTDYGILDVHLGPTSFLTEHHFTLAYGDEIEVTGSKVNGGTNVVIIAKELQRGSRLLELRDSDGRPYWNLGAAKSVSTPAEGTAVGSDAKAEYANVGSHNFKSEDDLLRDCEQPQMCCQLPINAAGSDGRCNTI